MRILTRLLLAVTLLGCREAAKNNSEVVAHMGGVTIPSRDLLAVAARPTPELRRDLTTAKSENQRRIVILNAVLKKAAAEAEARRLGFDKDPAVAKDMVDRMLEREVVMQDNGAEATDDDVRRYYQDHRQELTQPELVRTLQVVTRNREQAMQVAAKARAANASDLGAFQDLAIERSQDAISRVLGGDMGFFDSETTRYPESVVRAAFSMRSPFEISDPIESPLGFHVLKLVQRIASRSPALTEVTPGIRAKLRRQRLDAKKLAHTAMLLNRASPEIDFEVLIKIPFSQELLAPERLRDEKK